MTLPYQGGATTTNKWAIRLQLTKPVTWVPLIWGVACGAAASGKYNGMFSPEDDSPLILPKFHVALTDRCPTKYASFAQHGLSART